MSTDDSDRVLIARLLVRFQGIREQVSGDRKNIDVTRLSAQQLDVINECLLTRLTLMTKGGWCWFREEETDVRFREETHE